MILQVKISEWNPEKDLLAMVTEDSKILLHRFNWQRLWTVSPGTPPPPTPFCFFVYLIFYFFTSPPLLMSLSWFFDDVFVYLVYNVLGTSKTKVILAAIKLG